MSRAWIWLLALALATAGCMGSSDGEIETAEETGASDEPTEGGETANRSENGSIPNGPENGSTTLYAFEGQVNGTAPPNPVEHGGIASQGPAKAETFTVPANITDVLVEAEIPGATGTGRIEIVDSNGTVVASTHAAYRAGNFCSRDLGVNLEPTAKEDDGLDPGTYTVRYFVAGTMCPTVTVSAR